MKYTGFCLDCQTKYSIANANDHTNHMILDMRIYKDIQHTLKLPKKVQTREFGYLIERVYNQIYDMLMIQDIVHQRNSSENIPVKIQTYYHCKLCMQELPADQSPEEYQRTQTGATKDGLQIVCVRHNLNVLDMKLGTLIPNDIEDGDPVPNDLENR